MRIRTQLILAAFVLAVLPLAAIVTYSYHSSRKALESAYRREAERVTAQMDRRLATIRTELEQRVRYVGALPLPDGADAADSGSIATLMGEAATFVPALDFEPVHVTTHVRPEDRSAEKVEPADQPKIAEVTDAPESTQPPPAPNVPTERVVIEIPAAPQIPDYKMSEEQKELITELASLGGRIAEQNLSPDEKQDLQEEIRSTEEELRRVVVADRAEFIAQMREAREARRRQQAAIDQLRNLKVPRTAIAAVVPPTPPVSEVEPAGAPAAVPAPKPEPEVEPVLAPTVKVRGATKQDVERADAVAKKASLIFGRHLKVPVRQQGEVVGQLTARISAENVIRRILGDPDSDGEEIPFALDREGTLYTRSTDDRSRLDILGIPERLRRGQSVRGIEGWIVSISTDPVSGLKIGAARPVGDNLSELRAAAARNFGIGLGLIAFALIGIVPLSNHLTRDVAVVTDGADRIAHGDLATRLPVKTNNELGQLARAFNRMAEDLSVNQQKLVEQERARKEQELQQRLLAVEYERKTIELEEARRFQLSMLPKEVPQHPAFDIAVFTQTATEVGGDYYDFHLAGDALSVTIGDATGHGAKAGTMVTVVKTLFAGYAGDVTPAAFLAGAEEKIRRMDLGRMAMALSLARVEGRRMTLASAGMPPALVHRSSTDAVEEVAIAATPLGTMGDHYPEHTLDLATGDTVLFLSDGFPELMNDAGQQLGYAAAADSFAAAARGENAQEVIAALASTARRWHGDLPPNDDVTFVVLRVV